MCPGPPRPSHQRSTCGGTPDRRSCACKTEASGNRDRRRTPLPALRNVVRGTACRLAPQGIATPRASVVRRNASTRLANASLASRRNHALTRRSSITFEFFSSIRWQRAQARCRAGFDALGLRSRRCCVATAAPVQPARAQFNQQLVRAAPSSDGAPIGACSCRGPRPTARGTRWCEKSSRRAATSR